MHSHDQVIDVAEVVRHGPLDVGGQLRTILWVFVAIGILTFIIGVLSNPALTWGAYYVNLLMFMGLACGGVAICAILQIVRATWSPPVRRILEANVAFLPVAFCLWIITYAGKDFLFYWGSRPMPGREWWMQPAFVYGRFAVLLAILFFFMWRYVTLSLRSDFGWVREVFSRDTNNPITSVEVSNWKGSAVEVPGIQRTLSFRAPILIALYGVIYSLFAFENVMAMDPAWISNMFGGFIFIGNIFMAWAVLGIMVYFLTKRFEAFRTVITRRQLWDVGMLTFGFCMLWGYLFFSQFLPQWYSNMPEETQWLILRTREFPWKGLGWAAFSMCFVFPFIVLLSEDVKKAPPIFAIICAIILVGMWIEKYVIIMPIISPDAIPFSFREIGMFLGFLGAYLLSVFAFLKRVPFVPVSSPLTHGSADW